MEFTIPEITVVLETWHLVVGYIIIAMIYSRLFYYMYQDNHPDIHDSQYPGICAFIGVIWPITLTYTLLSNMFCLLFVPRSPKK